MKEIIEAYLFIHLW